MNLALSSRMALVPRRLRLGDQVIEQGPSQSGTTLSWPDEHAFDLGYARRHSPQASDPDGLVAFDRQKQSPAWRLELRDRGQIVLERLLDRKTEPEPRFQLLIAPGEVLQPQGPDDLQVPSHVSVADLDHQDTSSARASSRTAPGPQSESDLPAGTAMIDTALGGEGPTSRSDVSPSGMSRGTSTGSIVTPS
jgi:hypothetical protein